STDEMVSILDLAEKFEKEYRKLYGHWIENRIIEVESLKVIAASKEEKLEQIQPLPENFTPKANKYSRSYFGSSWQKTPVYELSKLKPGAIIYGPALISSEFSVFVVNPGWQYSCVSDNLTIAKKVKKAEQKVITDDIINLELFTNRFRSIANDMGALLQRTAFSVNIKERKDFSTAILNQDGLLVVNAPHIPVHLGSLGVCLRSVLSYIKIGPGDVVITNHPGHGGSHLPDITLITGVFTANQKLIGYVVNRAHHAELGGKTPGSMPPDASNLLQEGIIISPAYLVKSGEPQWQKIENLLKNAPYPSRGIAENLADLNAGLASLHHGSNSLLILTEKYTLNEVQLYMQMILDYSNQKMLQVFNKYKGNYEAEEFLDDDTCLKVKIYISDQGANFDFEGTSEIHPGNFNATPAIVNSVVIYVLRLMLNQVTQDKFTNIPLNEGILQNVSIKLPRCFLNPPLDLPPEECPAVVGGNTETSQRLTDTLLKALGLAACSQGTMNNLLFGDENFGYYETIGGGSGAGNGFNGEDGVHQHMTNTAITDPEIMELRYPARLDQFSIRCQSGGNGRWKGGNGIIRELTFLQPVQFSILTQHRKYAPYGMAGGKPGKPGNQRLIRKNGEEQKLKGVDGRHLQPGDRLIIETPGGGGYGKIEDHD
ncbi:MAG: hydantoinase B/oxoprolinase family protein, partial [Cyclobacteriaceae bacterium]